MDTLIRKVDRNGRIILTDHLRAFLDADLGEQVEFSLRPDGVLIRKAERPARKKCPASCKSKK